MKAKKQFKISAIVALVCGCIHVLATPMVLPALNSLPTTDYLTFAYMFIITGIALIFISLIQLLITRLTELSLSEFKILRLAAWFVFITGAGAVGAMINSFNPFAYLILLIGIYQLYLLKKIKHA